MVLASGEGIELARGVLSGCQDDVMQGRPVPKLLLLRDDSDDMTEVVGQDGGGGLVEKKLVPQGSDLEGPYVCEDARKEPAAVLHTSGKALNRQKKEH